MILKRVQINNYKNFKNETFEFVDGKINFISGKGGAGKSNLIRAICWCLEIDSQISSDRNCSNIEETNLLGEDECLLTEVVIDFVIEKYGIVRVQRSRKTIKRNGKLFYADNTIKLERIDNSGHKKQLTKNIKEIILNNIKRSVCLVNDHASRDIVRFLLSFITEKYNTNLTTSKNILKAIIPSANDIFKKICKKKYLDLIFDEADIKNKNFLSSPSESERHISVLSILIALCNFDNEVLILFDDDFCVDGEDASLFFKYISEINKQIIFTIHQGYLDGVSTSEFNLYGYYLEPNHDHSCSIARKLSTI